MGNVCLLTSLGVRSGSMENMAVVVYSGCDLTRGVFRRFKGSRVATAESLRTVKSTRKLAMNGIEDW